MLPANSQNQPDYAFMEDYMRQKEKQLLEKFEIKLSNFQKVALLSEKEWKQFELQNLFEIYTGGDLIISRITKGNIPIISHSKINNGIAGWTEPIKGQILFNPNETISLADRGNFYAFTQNTDFYIGTRVKALKVKFPKANKSVLQFICTQINQQEAKFSYGNNATGGIGKLKILLPINEYMQPDYEYMKNYIKQLEYEKLKRYLEYKNLHRTN